MDRRQVLLGMTAVGLAGPLLSAQSSEARSSVSTTEKECRKIACEWARELHDSTMQSLLLVDMQVEVLRQQAEANLPIGAAELGRMQSILREEMLNLREVMHQMHAIHVPQRLLAVLRDTVERFKRETGINARFITDLDELDMSPRACRELLRIVREGLATVRKRSAARHAIVRLESAGQNWTLTMLDDGIGFPFEGRDNPLAAVGKQSWTVYR
jgi:signal transduction histidine kinase